MYRKIKAALAAAAVMMMANMAWAEDVLVIELKSGEVKIELLDDIAPNHAARVRALAKAGAYDGIAFHRVIDGFMAQTGDVQFGKVDADGMVSRMAGRGASDMPDLKQEFSKVPFDRGIVGAARGGHSVDSANSQFFIMFEDGHFLNENYTVWGRVIDGMQHVDNIKRGDPDSGAITGKPDQMIRVYLEEAGS